MIQPTGYSVRDLINGREVGRLAEMMRFDSDLEAEGPELLKLAVEVELQDASRPGDEAHVDLTSLLMIGGADPRRVVDGQSALDVAIARGHWLAALVMDRWGHPPSADSDSLAAPPAKETVLGLYHAIEHRRFRELHGLLDAGVSVHTEVNGSSLLVEALAFESDTEAQVGAIHLDCSVLLLAMGADPWRPPNGKAAPVAAELAGGDFCFAPDVLLYNSWTKNWGTPRLTVP